MELGISKINIDTEIRNAFAQTVKQFQAENPDQIDPRKILAPAMDAMQQIVEHKIDIFRSAGRA